MCRNKVRLTAAAVLWFSGCVGSIDGASQGSKEKATGGAGEAGSDGGGGTAGSVAETCNTTPVSGPIRRLTRTEYDNTVRDLLGDTTRPALNFAADEQVDGFDNIASALTVSPLLAEQHEVAAYELASKAVGTSANSMDLLLGCKVSVQGQDECVRSFISAFGLRSLRHPLSDDENARYLAFYTESKQTYDFTSAVRMLVEAFLISPNFLYRVEEPTPSEPATGPVRLGPYELATRLSYLFLGSMPDKALFDAAASGQLENKDDVAAQARRLLSEPAARDVVGRFNRQWLEAGRIERAPKDDKLFPSFTSDLRALLQKETETFATQVVLDGDGTLSTLLRADYSFMNKELATFYGITGPTGSTFERVSLDPTQRSGVLTQAAILASNANAEQGSPIARGYFIRDRLLCSPPPPPPPTISAFPPAFDPNLTTRERFSLHRADPQCAQCHQMLDPVGLGFEHYDAVGQWREQEAGRAIDATGEMLGTEYMDGPFDGAIELAEKLAGSKEVETCFAIQWLRFAYGRLESEDECAITSLKKSLGSSGGNVRDLLIELTQTDAFLYRAAVGGAS